MRIGGFMASYQRPGSEAHESVPVFFGQVGTGSGIVNVNLTEEKVPLVVVDDSDDILSRA